MKTTFKNSMLELAIELSKTENLNNKKSSKNSTHERLIDLLFTNKQKLSKLTIIKYY